MNNYNTTAESFEAQVIRVLNDMVRQGEVITKVVNGEIYYSKPVDIKEKRSQAARKAVQTRNARAATKKAAAVCGSKMSMAAKKAWVTRKAKQNTPKLEQPPFSPAAVRTMKALLTSSVKDYKARAAKSGKLDGSSDRK